EELNAISLCALKAKELGLKVAAGHGLNYKNVQEIVKINIISKIAFAKKILQITCKRIKNFMILIDS
ncbi:pyridoxine 5'-phosphate synthase, partial [Campylobacter sp. TTU-622]